ncbi:myelin transcription factor-like protein [Parasponia andersonii]|uniref:Myelin transcription factor-like protein n=1 Tax=Parasponia andersonii TaxID=3476 RepID=A0A2P5C845_PARAD|nr:myelin transcription factor-like protein [Parasponia andersonii]
MDVMNIAERNTVDASSFFVFEVTADSESCTQSDSAVSGAGESSVAALDEDDAESCSFDYRTDQFRPFDSDSLSGDEFVIDSEYLEEGEFDDGTDEEEEDETTSHPVHRKWSRTGEIGVPEGNHKSVASVDSTTKEFESLNEMEKNRLFWETCLAS